MTRFSSLPALWLTALLPWCATAQENGVMGGVAIGLKQEGRVWNGQQVTLDLDLKTTGFSFSGIHFNLPEVSGAFLMQTDTTTIKLSEKKDGNDWQVIRYPLALYPHKPGPLTIPPIDVRFSSSAGYGSAVKDFEFRTEPLQVTVSQPPGVAEDALVVSTRSFQVEHAWDGVTDSAKTGDAFTLTVKRRAADISAMLLPPLPVYQANGLAAYPQGPVVTDRSERGSLAGERADSVIWVAEKAGNYRIPGIRFQWWDPASRELRQQVVPGIEIEVAASASDAASHENTVTAESRTRGPLAWLLAIVALVMIAGAMLRRRPGKAAEAGYPADEKSAFSVLQKACRDNHPGQAYMAAHRWLALHSPNDTSVRPGPTLAELARRLEDGRLEEHLQALQVAMITTPGGWRGQPLLASAKRARRNVNARKARQSANHLAPLNP